MSFFQAITEGGQTWAHRVRMTRQVIKIALLVSLLFSVIWFVYLMQEIPTVSYQALWYSCKSALMSGIEEKITVDRKFWAQANNESYSGPSQDIEVSTDKARVVSARHVDYLLKASSEHLKKTGTVFLYSFCGCSLFFLYRGWKGRKEKHLSGAKIAPSWRVSLKLKLSRNASDLKIASVPLVKGSETQHVLISGGTGSGKTNCMHHLLPQIRAKGHKAIIVDTTGIFISRYYRKGKDILLNPLDDRSAGWHPWAECRQPSDFDALAASFIPLSYSEHEDYWRIAAQTVFSAILQKVQDTHKISEAMRFLLYEPLSKLCSYVQGTKAAAHLDPSSDKTAGSIRSVAASFLASLEFLKDTETPFSISEWVGKKDDSWLFLSCDVGQRASLIPLLSSWFSIAMRGLFKLKPDIERRVWFIADELPSLHRLRDFEAFVTEGRKYGGCGLFAIQSPAQLDKIYGRDASSVILGNCLTRVIFQERHPVIAEEIAKTLGDRQIKELQEGISYGAHEVRDGVSLSLHKRRQPVVPATEIQSLKRHEAFLKLPEGLPVTKVKLKLIL